MNTIYSVSDSCRVCGKGNLHSILEYGDMPIADVLIDPILPKEQELLIPLTLVWCSDCLLLQLHETANPILLFNAEYPYLSSISSTWLNHCRDNVESLIKTFKLDPNSTVVELASNDGYLLRNFLKHNIPVLGIEPSSTCADIAIQNGVNTRTEFFDSTLAEKLQAEGISADLVISNNVLAHVHGLHDFVNGVKTILNENGSWIIEFPYVIDLIDGCAFDTVYHQHLCYFSVHSVKALLDQHGLFINDVQRLSMHGGSIRVVVSRKRDIGKSVTDLLEQESTLGIINERYYRQIAEDSKKVKKQLCKLIDKFTMKRQTVAAYGAAAKGTTLLAYCDLDWETISFVVDKNKKKHHKLLPGSRVPIFDPSRLVSDRPDACLLLPWNLKKEILTEQSAYRRQDGKFIIPLPIVSII